MKGEYVDEHQDESLSSHHQQQHHHLQHNLNISSSPQHANHQQQQHINMFPKFTNHPKFLSSPPHFITPQQQQPQQQPQFPQQQQQTYEDSDNNNNPTTTLTTLTQTPPLKRPKNTNKTTNTNNNPTTSGEDCGGTIEVQRRPRGRPPGSKNRPRPPIIITQEPEPAMSPYILELPAGSDIVDSLTRFTRRRGAGLCVLTASGAVANLTLKQPSTTTPAGTVTFHGRFDILSLSACISQNNESVTMGFTVTVAGPQGQIVGGKVVGPLVCAGTVFVVATSFSNPSFCRLPLEDNHAHQEIVVLGGGGGGDVQNSSPVSVGADGGSGGGGVVDGGMSMYSVQKMGSNASGGGGEVVWAPTAARPPSAY